MLKILTARIAPNCCPRRTERHGDEIMTEKTCAACDCQLDANPIRVRTVEVRCKETLISQPRKAAMAAA
jgi:hypothetical protein